MKIIFLLAITSAILKAASPETIEISQDPRKHSIAITYGAGDKILLVENTNYIFQKIKTDSRKKWIIVNVVPTIVPPGGRIEEFSKIYSTELKREVAPEEIDLNFRSIYFRFEEKGTSLFIVGKNKDFNLLKVDLNKAIKQIQRP